MTFKKFIKKHQFRIITGVSIIIFFIAINWLYTIDMLPSSFVTYQDGRNKPIMDRSCEELEYLLNEGWLNRNIGEPSDSIIIEIIKLRECFK